MNSKHQKSGDGFQKSKIKFLYVIIVFIACHLGFANGILPEPRFETKIVFSGYNANEPLTNFPALVLLSTNISGFSYANFVSPASGSDLRFTSTKRSKILNYEIESWNTNGTSYVWVQVDLLASNTSVYAMWGNASWSAAPTYTTNGATWNADYEAVWHLSEEVTGGSTTADAYRDSTANQRDGDQVGNSNINGPIGRAQYFDGSNDYINVPDTIVSTTDLTIVTWMRPDGVNGWDAIINHDGWVAGDVHYQFPTTETTLDYDLCGAFHADFSSFSFSTGEWRYVVAAYDRSGGGTDGTLTFYVDGELKQTIGGLTTALNPSPAPGHIGNWGLDRYFKGAMDEFRILSSVPSSNWFRATWLNMASNDQFNSYGEVKKVTPISGSLIAWGWNDDGQANCPPGSNFFAVAGGGYHSLAVRSDGTLIGWGMNLYGQTNCPTGSNFVAVAAGAHHSLALKSDGTLTGWGWNEYGQRSCPPESNFVAVAAGGAYSLALRSDGTLVGWGLNDYSQTNCPAGSDFVAIAGGFYHSLALKSDGTLVGWGGNSEGQADCPPGSDFVAVAAGMYHSLALRSNGTLVGWGYNIYGQINCPPGSDFVAVAAGSWHSLALRSDGTLVGWGLNNYGQKNCPPGSDFAAVAAGGYHSLAIDNANIAPQIATNALIFPELNSFIFAVQITNIIWDVDKITDDIDGTNLMISKITLHYADTTNEILTVTNNIANTLGEIDWYIPAGSWDGATNYVLKFEVVNSSSLTNSRIFWDNEFSVVPEPGAIGAINSYLLLVLGFWRKLKLKT